MITYFLYYSIYISAGNLAIASLLLKSKADISASANKLTCLHIACLESHMLLVGLLLGHRANPVALDEDGNSPLHHTSQAHIAVLLLQVFIEINKNTL